MIIRNISAPQRRVEVRIVSLSDEREYDMGLIFTDPNGTIEVEQVRFVFSLSLSIFLSVSHFSPPCLVSS